VPQLVAILWVVLTLAWLLAARRVRAAARTGDGPIPRWTAAAAGAVLALLGAGAALALAVAPAWSGRTAIETGGGDPARAPARARLFLHYVQVGVGEPGGLAVGYGPDAALRLPAAAGGALAEARRGWNLIQVGARGELGLAVSALPPPEPTATRLVAAAVAGGQMSVGELARRADAVARACRPASVAAQLRTPTWSAPPSIQTSDLASGEVALAGPGALIAVACAGARPAIALAFSRPAGAPVVRAVPLVRRGNRFEPHHIEIGPRSLLQIGSSADSAPGVELWEVPAPPGTTRLVVPPADPFAPCRQWQASMGEDAAEDAAERPGPTGDPDLRANRQPARLGTRADRGAADRVDRGANDRADRGADDRAGRDDRAGDRGAADGDRGEADRGAAADSDRGTGAAARGDRGASPDDDGRESICVLPYAAPFALEVRRLVPDTAGLATRSLWAAAMLILPALGWLLWLAAERRSRLTRARLADALAAAWVATTLAGLAVWRLVWAHRIDMLRDYESFGWRVVQNQVLVVLVAAALAATFAVRAEPGAPVRRRLLLGAAAWGGALLLGLFALGPDRSALAGDRALAAAGLSLLLGLGPLALPLLLGRLRAAAAADVGGAPRSPGLDLGLAPLAGLIAAGLVAAIAAGAAPREPSLKLALAWGIALLFHGALSAGVQQDRLNRRRLYAAAAAGAAAGLAALVLDPGIATAIVLPGLVFALLFAAHDASFDDRALRQVGSYRRRHAPLAACHTALVVALGVAAAVWATAGLFGSGEDGEAGRTLTAAAFHLPLLVAGFLAPAAFLVARRQGRAAAWPWAVAAAAAAVLWLAREPLLELVLASDSQAASRIALVSDPGYALLRNPDRFLAGLTAWRETALPAAASPWTGQGYFGAQLLDPGVLLSVENDYLALLILRESGAAGLLAPGLLLVGAAAGLFLLAGDRFRRGGAAERRRALAAILLGALAIYQPLAALGAVPLTGLPWPGLGIDSPSDFWLLTALLLFLAVWGRADDAELDAYDADLRRERRYARQRRAEHAAALLLAAAAVLVLARAAVGAAARPAMLSGTEPALAYARGLSCAESGGSSVPTDLVGQPVDAGSERFHSALRARWQFDLPATTGLAARLAARTDADPDQCAAAAGETGPWRAAPGDTPGECRLLLSVGLPEVELRVARAADGAPASVSCSIGPPDETLRRLRLPTTRPLAGSRVRLVSRAMGAAARDVGELVSGASVVRLRPGAELVSVTGGRLGLVAAGRVALGGGVLVHAGDEGARLELGADTAPGAAMLLVRDPRSDGWIQAPLARPSTPLDGIALIVTTGRSGPGGVWLFRPPTTWPGSPGDAAVDPILADDAATAAGPTRRAYPYGALLPELGWVNRFQRRRSLGLDGWVRVAVDELTASGKSAWSPPAASPSCGSLDPPAADPARVCALAGDGAIECRVSIQPELAVRMRHLTELLSLDPARFAGSAREYAAPLRSSFALLRGDTGEILAQAEFVPGRAASLYAPATAAAELRLIRAREDRDLSTGRLLPPAGRGEASGEKIDWNQPIAVGSALKPLVARAFERTDPELARRLVLRGAPFEGALCRGSRAHAIFGHCPPTDSLWNHPEEMSMAGFLAVSANWYMAAIGMLGTALPDGRVGLGKGVEVPVEDVLTRDVGDHATDAALWTERDGRPIITASRVIDLEALRAAPMWRGLEAVVGRPLCSERDKASCRRASDRADLCAARALPIAQPSVDLRYLVSLGPGTFDFQPETAPRSGGRVASLEYLQFLRGSGVHPLGSLLQLTDAFGRVVYEPRPGARGYRLAASWFPVASVAQAPTADCAQNGATGDPVRDGLCEVVRTGTAARALAPILADPSVVLYGAKTGTIDSLGDVAASSKACAAFREAHTLADKPLKAADQPYWLRCGADAQTPDDSLLLVAFGVPTPGGGVTPLTLGLRFQRSGAGFAAHVARHYIDLVRDYFAPPARRLP
jgi:hypothetical protein